MELIETSIFSRQVEHTFSAAEYRKIQLYLLLHSAAGVVIIGSGGLRKMRWNLDLRGKRGGERVIYYWMVAADQLYLLFVSSKSERSELSHRQLRKLRQLIDDDE